MSYGNSDGSDRSSSGGYGGDSSASSYGVEDVCMNKDADSQDQKGGK
ncbi:hypothetical protein [Pelosinus sp. UFO1]|nr:hypothetical protein [Pelosinus sp. UFO1]AIF49789.1 hypothetical protein UFO1_0228 [Pelosinus sp. UFO1]